MFDVAIDIEPLTIFFDKTTDFVESNYFFTGKRGSYEFDNAFVVTLPTLFCADDMKSMPNGNRGWFDGKRSGRCMPCPE